METKEKLKKYLLNLLPETERQTVEERLLEDEDFYASLLIAEEDLAEEYLENELNAAEKQAFEKYFLANPQRRADFNLIKNLKKIADERKTETEIETLGGFQPETPKIKKFDWNKIFPVLVPIAAAVIIVCGIAFWWNSVQESQADKGLVLLKEAFRKERPLQARLTGFDYAPFVRTRGGKDKENSETLKLAEMKLTEAAEVRKDTKSFYALGKFYLATHNYESAISNFKKALKADARNAAIHAELGAAYLELGVKNKETDDKINAELNFAAALGELNKALEADKSLTEPLFNRALVYENLKLPEKAEADWKTYLEKDSTSRWADEVRQKLRILEENKSKTALSEEAVFEKFKAAYFAENKAQAWEAIQLSRSRQGIAVAEKLIDDFLQQPPNSKNKENIEMLKFAGEVEKEKVGDFFLTETAKFYDRADTSQLDATRRARKIMKEVTAVYFNSQWKEAIKLFAEAKELFRQSGNEPGAFLAENFIGFSTLRIPEPETGRQIFTKLLGQYEKKKYLSFQAQSLIGISDAESNLNLPSKAVETAERALLYAKNAEDLDTEIRALQIIILTKTDFGQYREALKIIAEIQNFRPDFPVKPNVLWSVKSRLPEVFYRLGFLDAAIAFQEHSTEIAAMTGQPLLKSRSLEQTAIFYGEAGNLETAQKYLDAALLPAEENKDEKFRQELIARIALASGEIYRKNGDFQKALTNYETAQKIYGKEVDLSTDNYRIYGGKVLCLAGLKQFEAAREELQKAFQELEILRENIKNDDDRTRFFDIQQNYYDVAVGLAISQPKNPVEALEYTEKNRARSLLNLLKSEPLPISELQKRLPETVQVLEFAVLEDKIISWLITRSEIKSLETPIKSSELSGKIRRYTNLLIRADEAEKPETDELAAELFQILITPGESLLKPEKTLFIVPDKDLNFLPFAALQNPQTKKYLTENFSLGIAPSLNLFILSSEKGREKAALKTEGILSIGNPRFDNEKFSDLEDLPSAEREAEAVAEFYEKRFIFLRRDATKEKIATNLSEFEIIHLALHAVTDAQNSNNSGFLLSKTENSEGFLRAEEIYKMQNFTRTKLVVLSACETGIEQALRGEGAISLARPFMAGGVPLVTASLWKVDSEATAELMVNFHKQRKKNKLDSLKALQQAQTEMINNQNPLFRHPKSWASFIIVGGETGY